MHLYGADLDLYFSEAIGFFPLLVSLACGFVVPFCQLWVWLLCSPCYRVPQCEYTMLHPSVLRAVRVLINLLGTFLFVSGHLRGGVLSGEKTWRLLAGYLGASWS